MNYIRSVPRQRFGKPVIEIVRGRAYNKATVITAAHYRAAEKGETFQIQEGSTVTDEAKKRYDEKMARLQAAIALKEPDRVPINVAGGNFGIMDAGHTAAEIIYDETLEKMKHSIVHFLTTYDPDVSTGCHDYAGQGRALDVFGPKFIDWPGRPGTKIDPNSLHQFLEFPILLDEEFDKFFNDRTGWKLNNSMPKLAELFAPLRDFQVPLSHYGGLNGLMRAFSRPEMRGMIKALWELDDYYAELNKRKAAMMAEIDELGYPSLGGGGAAVPFDDYSDNLRGTMLSLTDLYENTEEVERFIDRHWPETIEGIKHLNPDGSKTGKTVFMALHKGIDGFMSDAHYEKYYWRYLKEIINLIIEQGMVPNIFCEGRYSTRLKFLKDIPAGKVIYRFEDTPLDLVKKELGDVACICGAFPNALLSFGTVEQVKDEVKRELDACAPGGGYMFSTRAGLTACKRENVVAMIETVREYGKY